MMFELVYERIKCPFGGKRPLPSAGLLRRLNTCIDSLIRAGGYEIPQRGT